MEEAKSIITTSEFTDTQTNFPPNVLANSNGFNDRTVNNTMSNQGHLTHFGSRQEYKNGSTISGGDNSSNMLGKE